MQNYDAVMTVAPGTTPASLGAPAAHHHHHHHQQQQHLHHRHHQQQQHEDTVQQQTSANWYDLQIKSEPIDYHHHHHHSRHQQHHLQQQQHTDHSNPTSPQSVDSMDSSSLLGKSAGFGSGTAVGSAAASLLSSGYNPLGFNPLTPPGYSGLLVPPPTTGGMSAQQQHRLGTPNRNGATAAVNLTPTHTPPMDVTPPKSPKETGNDRTPIKGDGGQGGAPSGCEGSNDGSDDEEGIRKPKVNSHGQVKKFKCKQCDFVAVTKLSFWEHTRHHIKPEKMLTCPQCPFVTEYKHHLEYHLRNHQRSKPFQCPECTYTCVNKSMLNSHMKSHSSVLQYHCANCQYATKYCHSLKLHLRKNGHKPGVVLNQDGTPNPLPIIDVYGTRRGPKAKPTKASGKKLESCGEPEPKSTPATPQQHPGGGSSPRGDRSPYTPLGAVGNSAAAAAGGANGLMRNLLPHQLFPNPLASMFKSAAAAANGSMPLFPYLNLNFQMFADQQAAAMAAQLSPGSFQQSLIGQLAGGVNLNNNHSGSEDNDLSLKSSSTTSNSSSSSHSTTLGEELLKQITAAAADSSASAVKVKSAGCFEDSEPDTDRLFEPDYRAGVLAAAAAISNPVTPSTGNRTERSRRKGRAFKLERMPSSSSNGPAQEMDTQEQYTADREVVLTRGATPRLADGSKEQEQITPEKVERSFECKYCDIAFRDDVLYTIHMGYHGYDEVFKCNMCGEKSEDRIGFFLHIARKAH